MSEGQDVSKLDRQIAEITESIEARNRGSALVVSALSDLIAARLGREACEELLAELRQRLESQTAHEDPDTRQAVCTYLANLERALRDSSGVET